MPKSEPNAAAESPVDAAESAVKEAPASTVDSAESTVHSDSATAESPAADESPSLDTAAESESPAVADTVTTVDELRAQLEAALDESAQFKDAMLRAKAEAENTRRRAQDEVVKTRKFAIEGFAKELLEVKDNLDRAAAVALDDGAGAAVQMMKEGLGLTRKQLDAALARFAVVEVEAAPGVKFDPARHQAVSTAPAADIAPDHIVEVVQKGFVLRDERLLRPAMVVVAAKG